MAAGHRPREKRLPQGPTLVLILIMIRVVVAYAMLECFCFGAVSREAGEDSSRRRGGQRVVVVRVEKTGTQPLVAALRDCSFAACGSRRLAAASNTNDCRATAWAEWHRQLHARSLQRSCFLDSYCDWDSLEPLATADEARLREMANSSGMTEELQGDDDDAAVPPSPLVVGRALVVTMVRDAVERVVLEYAYSCVRGSNARGDYTTTEWRQSRRPFLEALQRDRRNMDDDYSDVVFSTPRFAKPAFAFPPREDEKRIQPPLLVDCRNVSAFESFLLTPAHANGMRNRQTRMLSGARMLPDTVDARPERDLYDIARRNIENHVFDVVLVFELFQESLLQLANKLGLSPLVHYALRQEWFAGAPIHRKPRLDDQTIDLVRRFNYYDDRLHRLATNRLEKTAARAGRSPTAPWYDCVRRLAVDRFEYTDCTLKPQFRDADAEQLRNASHSFRSCVRKRNNRAATHENLKRRSPSEPLGVTKPHASGKRPRYFCKRPGLMCTGPPGRTCWKSQACAAPTMASA